MSLASRLSPKSLWATYSRLLKEKPLATRAITSGVILGLADATCQKMERRDQPINKRRCLSMAATGLVLVGPSVHMWYTFLGRLFGEAAGFATVAKKLALDQAIFAPIMFGTIMTTASLLNGKSVDETKAKLDAELWGAVKRGWCLWSVATSINFSLVPPMYRVLYNNTVSFGWNTFLSSVNNRPLPSEQEQEVAVDNTMLSPVDANDKTLGKPSVSSSAAIAAAASSDDYHQAVEPNTLFL